MGTIRDEFTKKLGFGCMRLPVIDGNVENIDDEAFKKMVDHFMEQGFTYFDTAFPYHNQKSEAAVKRCLVDRYPRESFMLATKMPGWEVKETADYARIFNLQLERTGAGYFDYYLIHAIDAQRIKDYERLHGIEELMKFKEQGKIRHLGFSFHDSADALEDILKNHPELEFVQLQINYYDWDSEGVQSRKCYEVACKYNVPVIVMEPIKGGTLANLMDQQANYFKEIDPNASVASYAIRYVASLENVVCVLSGMSNWEQLYDNTSYMKDFKPLSEKEQEAVTKVVTELKAIPTIPCTRCRYCVEDCPKKIVIPEIFFAYNYAVQFGVNDSTKGMYNRAVNGHGAPTDCIKCGKCEGHCPQHLSIRDLLVDCAEKFA